LDVGTRETLGDLDVGRKETLGIFGSRKETLRDLDVGWKESLGRTRSPRSRRRMEGGIRKT
jgi:hypothetical protein